MTQKEGSDYCPLDMDQLQYKRAFVVQFRTETDITAAQFDGRVEHVASGRATRFHSLDELLGFIAELLAEFRDTEQP
jgi:hypothetical protein